MSKRRVKRYAAVPVNRQAKTTGTNENRLPAGFGVVPGIVTRDAIVNQLARIGTPDTLLSQNEVSSNRITSNYSLLDRMYRSDWIARKIIDTIADDMTKNWYEFACTIEPDQINEVEKTERVTHLKNRILEGVRLGRLYGGAAGIIVIKGHEDSLEEPLEVDTIMPGSFRGLIIADRWNGVEPSLDIVSDLDDPDFGQPEYYTFTLHDTELEQGIRVHHSRVVRFEGRYLPLVERMNENGWGMSELEHVYDELNKRNTTSSNVAHLIFNANLRVLKMNDLGQQLALSDEQSQRDLYAVLSAQNQMMNSMSLQVMDREDDLQTFQYTFSGLSEIYQNFMNDLAGAAEIPATRLFGRSPDGQNSTGESDLRNYYDVIRQWQEAMLRPVLEKIVPVLCMSALGEIPDDLAFEFKPIRDTSDEERASMIQQTAGAINMVFGSGIISQRTALKELRAAGDPLGMWTNITDEDIENADDGTNPEGEDMMGGGDPMAEMMQGMMGGSGEGAEEAPEQPEAQGMPEIPEKQAPGAAQAPKMNENTPKQKTPTEAVKNNEVRR